jgi:amino acid permease
MGSEELFSREEVLGGMPAQRARTLLFLIESRTAQLVGRSRRAMERFLSDEVAGERDMEFFAAFSAGKDPPLRPTIQDLERFSALWAGLVPENPGLRAVLAQLLGEKYSFTYRSVPGIRRVLALDGEAVQRAYQRQFKRGLESIYEARPGLGEQARWVWARLSDWLESLPPFWTAFALTLTETVGAGIMALPIALAGIGPLAGVGLLVLIGLVNTLTIAYMAEAVSRSGEIRYGSAYLGRLVEEYLGRAGSVILSTSLVLLSSLALLAYFIGLTRTMEDATRLPATLWAVLLFLVNLYFLRKKTLNATVSAALMVGAVNIGVILSLALITIPWIRVEHLTYVNLPYLNGQPFDPSILQLVFGVVLVAYFGHTSMANCAKVVLRRDPSSRSLIWGSVAAQFAVIGLYTIWLLSINGAVPASELASLSGTALEPLARRVGPFVYVLGSIFVLLGMGMASIHYSLGFFNLTQEWLPKRPRSSVSEEVSPGGLGVMDLIALPEGQRRIMDWLMRNGQASPAELSVHTGRSEHEVRPDLEALAARGFVTTVDTPQEKVYCPQLASKKGRQLPDWIWETLGDTVPGQGDQGPPFSGLKRGLLRIGEAVLSEPGRFVIGILPLGLIFLLTVWLLITNSESFSRPLSFIGVIAVSLLGGIFPAILLVASRKKGERAPKGVSRLISHPLLIIGIYLISQASLLAHALVIWQNPFERLSALAASLTMLVVTVIMIRQKVFAPRLVVELRQEGPDTDPEASFAITMAGQNLTGEVQFEYGDGWKEFAGFGGNVPHFTQLRTAVFRMPTGEAHDLKVWAHRVTPEGDTEGLPVRLEMPGGSDLKPIDLSRSKGQYLIPLDQARSGLPFTIRLIFGSPVKG